MHTDFAKASPPSCFARCTGCGRQIRVAVDRLLAADPVLCGWCEQDLVRAEQVCGAEAIKAGPVPADDSQGRMT
jgi:hypothetical protein